MKNYLLPTCRLLRSWCVKNLEGTRGKALVPMSGICTTVEHCFALMIPSWMTCWMKLLNKANTKGNMLAAPTKMYIVHRGDTKRVVFRDWRGLKLQKIKFYGRLEGPHKHTRTARQQFIAAMLSATILERVVCLRKRSTVDEEMAGHRAAPTILVRSPTDIDRRWLRQDADCIDFDRREHTIFRRHEDLQSVIPTRYCNKNLAYERWTDTAM